MNVVTSTVDGAGMSAVSDTGLPYALLVSSEPPPFFDILGFGFDTHEERAAAERVLSEFIKHYQLSKQYTIFTLVSPEARA